MPHASLIVAPVLPGVLRALAGRPELKDEIYILCGERFPDVPDTGLVLVRLPMWPRWRASEGPLWFEPNPDAYPEPPEPFEGSPPDLWSPSNPPELVFDPEDIARRFPVIHGELPPKRVAQFCKHVAQLYDCTTAWYNYLDRGDTLYHDVAWIFGNAQPPAVSAGVRVTLEVEAEELSIYDGFSGPKWRGWHLWGNTREQSRVIHSSAAAAIALRFGLGRPASIGFPYDFPSYSNITGNYWQSYRFSDS